MHAELVIVGFPRKHLSDF